MVPLYPSYSLFHSTVSLTLYLLCSYSISPSHSTTLHTSFLASFLIPHSLSPYTYITSSLLPLPTSYLIPYLFFIPISQTISLISPLYHFLQILSFLDFTSYPFFIWSFIISFFFLFTPCILFMLSHFSSSILFIYSLVHHSFHLPYSLLFLYLSFSFHLSYPLSYLFLCLSTPCSWQPTLPVGASVETLIK